MTKPPPYTDDSEQPDLAFPRWVKAFALITLLVIILVVILLSSGGSHSPGRH